MSSFRERCETSWCVCCFFRCRRKRQHRRSVQIDPQIIIWEYDLTTTSYTTTPLSAQLAKSSELVVNVENNCKLQDRSSSVDDLSALAQRSNERQPVQGSDVNYSSSNDMDDGKPKPEVPSILIMPHIVTPEHQSENDGTGDTGDKEDSKEPFVTPTVTPAPSTTVVQPPPPPPRVVLQLDVRENEEEVVVPHFCQLESAFFPMLSWRTYDTSLPQPSCVQHETPEQSVSSEQTILTTNSSLTLSGNGHEPRPPVDYTQHKLCMNMVLPEYNPDYNPKMVSETGIAKHDVKHTNTPSARLSNVCHACFNEVYLARFRETNELLAVKVQLTMQRKRAEIELKVLICVRRSPFIVDLHSHFCTMLALYIVLEYVPGGKLTEKLTEPFSLVATAFYSAQIVLALSHLHKHAILYRDLKPDNILLTQTGYLKLCDFGSCLTGVKGDKKVKVSTGTPRYWAPEKFDQQPYGRPSDWWSLGIIVYQMLMGTHPFANTTCNYDIYKDLVVSMHPNYSPSLDSDAVSLCKGLLDKDPERRLGGPQEKNKVYEHTFYRRFIKWGALKEQKLVPPPMYATRVLSVPTYREQ